MTLIASKVGQRVRQRSARPTSQRKRKKLPQLYQMRVDACANMVMVFFPSTSGQNYDSNKDNNNNSSTTMSLPFDILRILSNAAVAIVL